MRLQDRQQIGNDARGARDDGLRKHSFLGSDCLRVGCSSTAGIGVRVGVSVGSIWMSLSS